MTELAVGIFLLVATLTVVLQVFARYVFAYSFTWSEEISRYLIIWMVFIEAGVAVAYGIHTVVDFGPSWLPILNWRMTRVAARLIMIAFLATTLWAARPLVVTVTHQISPGLGIPMIIPYAGMFLGVVFMIVVLIVDIRK